MLNLPTMYLQEAQDKIIIKFDLIDGKLGIGNLYFKDLMVKVMSGPYGDGYLAFGTYKGYRIKEETREAFAMFGVGWQLPLRNAETGVERGYAVHPDGNVPGSKGCVACQFETKEDNIKLKNMIKYWLEVHSSLEVLVC